MIACITMRVKLTNERYQIRGLIGVKNIFLFTGPEWYYHVDDDGVAYTDRVLNFFAGWFPPKWARIRNFGTVGIRDDKDTFFIRPEINDPPDGKARPGADPAAFGGRWCSGAVDAPLCHQLSIRTAHVLPF